MSGMRAGTAQRLSGDWTARDDMELSASDLDFVNINCTTASAQFIHSVERTSGAACASFGLEQSAQALEKPDEETMEHWACASCLPATCLEQGCGGASCKVKSGVSEQDLLLLELIEKLGKPSDIFGSLLATTAAGGTEMAAGVDVDADADYVRLEPSDVVPESHVSSSLGSSVGSRFSFVIQRVNPDDISDIDEEVEEPALRLDVDDREESDQVLGALGAGIRGAVDVVSEDRARTEAAALAEADLVPGGLGSSVPLVRHYKHDKNSRINAVLTVSVAATLVLAIGVGIGHWIGTSREASLQQQIREDQNSKLTELKDDLMMCLRKQEDISQTITKLNEIEAILVDAEHWRGEYEELLKLKVQAEDSWRHERDELMERSRQLERSNGELERAKACPYSDFMLRQELKLDSVHVKLQAALDHKERQVQEYQLGLTEYRLNATLREEVIGTLTNAMDDKSRAIVQLKEQLLDTERELLKVKSSVVCQPSLQQQQPDAIMRAAVDVRSGSDADTLKTCTLQLAQCTERAISAEDALLENRDQLALSRDHWLSCQARLNKELLLSEDLQKQIAATHHSHSEPVASHVCTIPLVPTNSCRVSLMPLAAGCYANSSCHSCMDSELVIQRCAELVLLPRNHANSSSVAWSSLNESLFRLAAMHYPTNGFGAAPSPDQESDLNLKEQSNLDLEEEKTNQLLTSVYRNSQLTVSRLVGIAKNSWSLANSSWEAFVDKSDAYIRKKGYIEKIKKAQRKISKKLNQLSHELSKTVGDVTANMMKLTGRLASAWKGAKKENAAERRSEDVAEIETAFMKNLDKLLGRIQTAATRAEGLEIYKAFERFVTQYSKYDTVVDGIDWKGWSHCQLAWWEKFALELTQDVTVCNTHHLQDWQRAILESATASVQPPVIEVETSVNDVSDSEPVWVFQRAADREYQRDTPDNWYWRKAKDIYSTYFPGRHSGS